MILVIVQCTKSRGIGFLAVGDTCKYVQEGDTERCRTGSRLASATFKQVLGRIDCSGADCKIILRMHKGRLLAALPVLGLCASSWLERNCNSPCNPEHKEEGLIQNLKATKGLRLRVSTHRAHGCRKMAR